MFYITTKEYFHDEEKYLHCASYSHCHNLNVQNFYDFLQARQKFQINASHDRQGYHS